MAEANISRDRFGKMVFLAVRADNIKLVLPQTTHPLESSKPFSFLSISEPFRGISRWIYAFILARNYEHTVDYSDFLGVVTSKQNTALALSTGRLIREALPPWCSLDEKKYHQQQ